MEPERIAHALGGRRSGRGWSARCPLHGDRHASLSIWIDAQGRIGVFCHAGCDWRELVTHLKARGLWSDERHDPVAALAKAAEHQRKNHEEAYRLWHDSIPLELTPGEHYLRHWRAISGELPSRLRWHRSRFAIVSLVSDPISGRACGVHLTLLNRLTNKREDRLLFGRSGVVRLHEGGGEIVIGEGIETTLSGAAIVGAPSAWSALSAPGISSLRLPSAFRAIGLLVDRDSAGETSCQRAAERLAKAVPGRAIRLLRPAPPHKDFNDLQRALAEGDHG